MSTTRLSCMDRTSAHAPPARTVCRTRFCTSAVKRGQTKNAVSDLHAARPRKARAADRRRPPQYPRRASGLFRSHRAGRQGPRRSDTRLSRIGAAAKAANRPAEFNMPPSSATIETSSRYGKRDTGQLNGQGELLGLGRRNPGAKTRHDQRHGKSRPPERVTSNRRTTRTAMASDAKRRAAGHGLRFPACRQTSAQRQR